MSLVLSSNHCLHTLEFLFISGVNYLIMLKIDLDPKLIDLLFLLNFYILYYCHVTVLWSNCHGQKLCFSVAHTLTISLHFSHMTIIQSPYYGHMTVIKILKHGHVFLWSYGR